MPRLTCQELSLPLAALTCICFIFWNLVLTFKVHQYSLSAQLSGKTALTIGLEFARVNAGNLLMQRQGFTGTVAPDLGAGPFQHQLNVNVLCNLLTYCPRIEELFATSFTSHYLSRICSQ